MKFGPICRFVFRWTLRLIAGSAAIIVLLGLFYFRGALYHRYVRFPREAAAWATIQADRQPAGESTGWQEYRGIVHSHSQLSHDCEVPFEQILAVLKETGRDFICLSDHCAADRADFDRQWRGLHEGKLFIPGFEMRDGLMPFGAAPGTVLNNRTDVSQLARQIVQNGGVLFYAHPEEPRDWKRPELQGMEIYNIHADFKDERRSLTALLPDVWLSLDHYPDQVVRLIFDRPVANLQRWDELNRNRHLTGIAGNDCHQNTGIRGLITATNTWRIEDTSSKILKEFQLKPLTRLLLRAALGPLQPGRILFHLQLDPYERMARFVTTHVLARELTESAILDSLRAGRVFVGFDMLADSTGFFWLAQDQQQRTVMGESRPYSPSVRLRAAAPHACRLTILKDGAPVAQTIGRSYEYLPPGPGVYRVEAELRIRGEWTPWIYANPIWIGR